MAAVVAPFVLASLFPIINAVPLERRGNSTVSRGFEGPTQFGPWTVPFWAYILIIGLITTASLSLLVFLVKFLLSISCWTLCSTIDTILAEKGEQHREKQVYQVQTQQLHPQPLENQPTREYQDSPTRGANTDIPDHPHIRTYSTHSSNGAYTMNQSRAGNIAPYHQYHSSLPGAADPSPHRHQQHQRYPQQQYQQHQCQIKRTGSDAFAFPLVPASMLSSKPPPRASSRPSSDLDPTVPWHPPGLEHKYSASH